MPCLAVIIKIGGEKVSKNKDYNFLNQSMFIQTDYTNSLSERASWYLNTGYPVHLRGPAGVGKTSLAFHIAKELGNPIIYICGSKELGESEMIGNFYGSKNTLVIDNFISSVYKREEEQKKLWTDGKLVTACKNGYTFIYDEFTRTSPEVNNILLPILEERILEVPENVNGNSIINISKDFKMIFTSNPSEYVGVFKSTNALIDRMITIDITSMDEETEKLIIVSKSNLTSSEAEKIIKITKQIRKEMRDLKLVSIRSSLMMANIISKQRIKLSPDSAALKEICMDIFGTQLSNDGLDETEKAFLYKIVNKSIHNVFYNTLND